MSCNQHAQLMNGEYGIHLKASFLKYVVARSINTLKIYDKS